MDDPDWFTQFEDLGVPQVRDLAPRWQGELQRCAYKWLKMKSDQAAREEAEARKSQDEARRLTEASHAEQIRNAHDLRKMAVMAAVAAVTAVPVSVIALAISVVTWLHHSH